MGKKLKNKKVVDAQRKEYYVSKDPSGKINKLIFPNTLQVGLNSDLFNSTISGSIHHTRQGVSYLVAGSNIAIASGSNGQVTVSATAGASASPNAAFTRSIIPVDTDDTGGALDDGGDLSDADISEQAFTKIDVSVGITKLTFAGHNETGDPVNNTYKMVSDSITAFTDNGTELTEANTASEGDASYNVTFANSGTRLTLAVSTDSSDAKLKVSTLSEHEVSTTDFNSIVVNIPIKYTTDAGTSTVTRSFTVQKIKKGTTGSTGSEGAAGTIALAIFGIDSSSGEIAVVPTASSTSALTTPYDTAVIANTNVVSSNSSGELTLAATGTYSVTVSIRIQQEGDATNVYELVLSVDDGAGSYTSLAYLDDATPGADEKTANLLISNAIVVVSSGGTKKLKSEIKKSAANTTYAHVPQSSTQLATIRVEKLS